MNDVAPPDGCSWPPSLALHVEDVCTRFEAAWQAGEVPTLEAYLAATPESARPVVLRELLALELEYRGRTGRPFLPEEYAVRFPSHADVVRAVIAAAAAPSTLPEPDPAAPSDP